MTSSFLSRADVERLTCRKQKRRQIERLARMGIQFELDADGWPLVRSAAREKGGNPMEKLAIEALLRVAS